MLYIASVYIRQCLTMQSLIVMNSSGLVRHIVTQRTSPTEANQFKNEVCGAISTSIMHDSLQITTS